MVLNTAGVLHKAGLIALAMALAVGPALAGDKPLFAPTPSWVTAAPDLLDQQASPAGAFLPLFDEQVMIDGDTVTSYVDAAYYIASAEALNQRGTLSLDWQPAHGDLTIHKIEILRGKDRIDALAGGPGFTVLRREAGLERRIVDGALTAVKHVEGLRVGDMLHVIFSVSERDPVLKGNAQAAVVLLPKPVQVGFGRARLVWPRDQAVTLKAFVPGVDLTPKEIAGGRKEVAIALPIATLPEMPAGVPVRFQPTPVVVGSTFKSWSEVAAVMAPLYATDGVIADGSDLAKVVDGIAARNADPVARMADALQIVQEDVRYQLMAMGTGNYVPQAPADTWQKRFGDCKAKTLLLLAILHRMGITAEPALANIARGTVVPDMPPSAMAFDHVIVGAKVNGESFWLDGTSLGSRIEDIRDVPRFGSVLPLRVSASDLVTLPSRPHNRFDVDIDLVMDHTGGPHLPVPFTLTVHYAGLTAAQVRVKDDATAVEQLKTFAENLSKNWTGSTTIAIPAAAYNAKDATWTVSVDGVAYPEWAYLDGRYELAFKPTVKIDFDPDRSRSTWRQIPAQIDNPWTAHARMTLRLPDGGAGASVEGSDPVTFAVPAVSWQRTLTRGGETLVEDIVARENGSEIAPADIGAAKKSIADAMASEVRVKLLPSYPQRWDDVARRRTSSAFAKIKAVFDKRVAAKPDDAVRLEDRGWLFERLLDWKAAEADYTAAIALDASPERYLKRSQIRASVGDHANALKDAQAAYDIDSSNRGARNQLALELVGNGMIDEGIDLTEAHPDLSTDDGQSLALARVEVLERSGRHDDAMSILQSAVAKRPSVPTLLNARCWFQALRNAGLDQALKDCDRAIELASNPAGFLDSRAMVHFRAGRMNDALADLNSALAISPEIAPSHFMKGVIFGRLGRSAEASRELATARKLYPDVDRYLGTYGIKP